MNILHMSDLHLGRRFYNLSFLPIQQALLQEVLQIIDDQQVTVLFMTNPCRRRMPCSCWTGF